MLALQKLNRSSLKNILCRNIPRISQTVNFQHTNASNNDVTESTDAYKSPSITSKFFF